MNKYITKEIQDKIDEYKKDGFISKAQYLYNIEVVTRPHTIYVLLTRDAMAKYFAVSVDSKEQAEEIIKELSI